jgi:hypothetical protein
LQASPPHSAIHNHNCSYDVTVCTALARQVAHGVRRSENLVGLPSSKIWRRGGGDGEGGIMEMSYSVPAAALDNSACVMLQHQVCVCMTHVMQPCAGMWTRDSWQSCCDNCRRQQLDCACCASGGSTGRRVARDTDVVVVLATATPALGDSGTSATSSAIASSSPSSWSATGSASPHPSASPNTANGPVGGGGSGAVVTFAINATGLSDEEVQGRLVLAANLSQQ